MAGMFKTFSHKMKSNGPNPQIWGMRGVDGPAGKPADAIQYCPQGVNVFGTKFDPQKQPLTPELKAKGVTEEEWVKICKSLRANYSTFSGGFSKAITAANKEYFEKLGCVACYAEYHKGCKAMVVYTKEAADAGAVVYMKDAGITIKK